MSERYYTQHAHGPAKIEGAFWLQGPQKPDDVPAYVRAAFAADPRITLVLIQIKQGDQEAFALYEPLKSPQSPDYSKPPDVEDPDLANWLMKPHDLPPMTSRLADKNQCSHHMHRVHPPCL